VTVDKADYEDGYTLTALDLTSGKTLWSRPFEKERFDGWIPAADCLIVGTVSADGERRSRPLALRTGEPCTTIPELAVPPDRLSVPPYPAGELSPDAAQKWTEEVMAHAAARQVFNDKLEELRRIHGKDRPPGPGDEVTRDGVTYAIEPFVGRRLSARSGGAALWTRDFPSASLAAYPLVATEAVVIVPAVDRRTESRWRLLGFDRRSGELLYVTHLGPGLAVDIQLREAGEAVIFQTAWLGAIDARTGKVLWTSQR
jgi:hypothetical protein